MDGALGWFLVSMLSEGAVIVSVYGASRTLWDA